MDSKGYAWYYYLLRKCLKAAARCPLGLLYAVSDVLYLIVYYVVRYRRKVVESNLLRSFPEMTKEQRHRVSKQFYRHFSDSFVETIKLDHISDAEMKRRMIYENTELVDRLFSEGRSMVCYFSHCGNWEWAPSITLWTKHHPTDTCIYSQVYRPLINKWFDDYYLHLRRRFHSVSYPKHSVLRDLIRQRRAGALGICGFMSDQKPSHGDPTHVMLFLGQPTAMITGTETLARKLDMAVVYMDMYKLRRGHYKIVMRLIAENPSELPPMTITERYAELLEQTIRRNPSIWLWTHKRWKIPVKLPKISDQ